MALSSFGDLDRRIRTKLVTEGDELFVVDEHDFRDILDNNKAEHNLFDRPEFRRTQNQVASIPVEIFFELERKGIAWDDKALNRWMDDPDNRCFRTRPGKLS